MVKKIVEVFLRDKRVRSYVIAWRDSNAPIPDSSFVERAKEVMIADYPKENVAAAKFVVSGTPNYLLRRNNPQP